MYAIISTGGKQLTVRNEEIVAVERLAGEVGTKVTFDKVLAIGEGAGLRSVQKQLAQRLKQKSWNTSAVLNLLHSR